MASEWLLKFRALSARSHFLEHCADSADSAESPAVPGVMCGNSTARRAIDAKEAIGTPHSKDPADISAANAQVETDCAADIGGPAAPIRRGVDGLSWWRDLYEERAAFREYDGGISRAEAEQFAWRETENRWHLQYGERVRRDLCAGCRRPIGSDWALDVIDTNRVHQRDNNACLIRHGERWRATARQALLTLGLQLPR
jgi:hypothetical protein